MTINERDLAKLLIAKMEVNEYVAPMHMAIARSLLSKIATDVVSIINAAVAEERRKK